MSKQDRTAWALIVLAAILLGVLLWVTGCRRIERWERRLDRAEDTLDTAERIKEKAEKMGAPKQEKP